MGRRRWWCPAILALVVVASGCSDDDDDASSATSEPGSSEPSAPTGEVPYVMSFLDGWTTKEHADPPAAELTLPDGLSLDWYSSYERSHVDGDRTIVEVVAVQGHHRSAAAMAQSLPGHRFQATELAGWHALAGAPIVDGEPPIVLLDLGDDRSASASSYELALEELVAFAAELRAVSEEEWAAVPSMP